MPTFSVPTGTATAHSSDLKSTNTATTVAATVAVATVTKKKTRENKNNNKKKTHIIEESVIATAEADADEDADAVVVTHSDTYNDDEPLETIEEVNEPTFPDIVILKQTDRNYIVKHNHYPLCNTENKTNDDMSNSTNTHTGAAANYSTAALMQPSDLVSPNQIYKGQINKKRGRKPKAGFILNSNSGIYDTSEVPNIILHLKCHISDLKTNDSMTNYDYTPSIGEVESYNLSTNILQSSDICQSYQPEDDETSMISDVVDPQPHASHIHQSDPSPQSAALQTQVVPPATVKPAATDSAIHILNERHQKEIVKKINRLKYSFHNGETIQMKINHKCACFWDTCEFDGPIYYLPIMIVNGVFHVSGCFCSPECALAALLKEQLDTSTKFERIHLLHLLYGSSSNKGFKPAPNPNYLLDKYYGNLTIDEYRSLLKGPQMIHIVNKPLTHILPELYEDNNDFLVNSKVIPTNNLKLKKRYKTMVVQGGGGGD